MCAPVCGDCRLFRLSPLVGDGFSYLGQFFIGGDFFLLGLAEEFQRFVVAHLFGPRAERAVTGDFVMLHFLAGGNNARVQSRGVFLFFDDVIALGDQALHGLARFALERLIERFRDLFEARNVFLGFLEVLFEGFAQLVGLCGLREFGQRFGQLLLGAVNVGEFVEEQFMEFGVYTSGFGVQVSTG